MTNVDLTEAVDIAAQAHWAYVSKGREDTPWEYLEPIVQHAFQEHSLTIVSALADAGLLRIPE